MALSFKRTVQRLCAGVALGIGLTVHTSAGFAQDLNALAEPHGGIQSIQAYVRSADAGRLMNELMTALKSDPRFVYGTKGRDRALQALVSIPGPTGAVSISDPGQVEFVLSAARDTNESSAARVAIIDRMPVIPPSFDATVEATLLQLVHDPDPMVVASTLGTAANRGVQQPAWADLLKRFVADPTSVNGPAVLSAKQLETEWGVTDRNDPSSATSVMLRAKAAEVLGLVLPPSEVIQLVNQSPAKDASVYAFSLIRPALSNESKLAAAPDSVKLEWLGALEARLALPQGVYAARCCGMGALMMLAQNDPAMKSAAIDAAKAIAQAHPGESQLRQAAQALEGAINQSPSHAQ